MNLSVDEYVKKYLDSIKNIKVEISDIYLIISNYLNMSKNDLYLKKNDIYLSKTKMLSLNQILNKVYIENVPVQYIIGKTKFFNEEYLVTEDVLIPRPDTEILVEKAILYIERFKLNSIIDMCTGSGCVGISIANNSLAEDIFLVDISESALNIAKRNIKHNNVKKDIKVVKSDLFKNIEDKKFDMLVSNPPYIKTDVIKTLDESVKKEPNIALDGGEDGMKIYSRILKEAKPFLRENAIVMFEIGFDQKEDILMLISSCREYEVLECVKDLGKNDRVVICRFHQM